MLVKIVAFLFFSFVFSNNWAQKSAFTIEDLYKVKSIGSPVISPDSKKFLFSVTSYDLSYSNSNTDIYVSDIDGNNQRHLTNHKSIDLHLCGTSE